jgi:MFS family permease
MIEAVCLRFLTGFTLAGIYPVGMKIVASWFRTGLGWHLGILIGALTLGKSSAYFLQAMTVSMGWRGSVSLASLGSLLGGLLVVLCLSDGPFLRDKATFDFKIIRDIFKIKNFRNTAFGYFGHMWELYAFWALIGFYVSDKLENTSIRDQTSLWTSLIIGVGVFGCVGGGYISRWIGQRRVAVISLLFSGAFCLFSGWIYDLPHTWVLASLLMWGFFVVADSAQFSALAARYCPTLYTGTALTLQNGLGFLITIFSIQLVSQLADPFGWRWAFLVLVPGPVLGILSMNRLPKSADHDD